MTLPPDLLVEYFDLLLERAAALRAGLAAGDAAGLRTLAHQVAGTGAAYGYPELTRRGRALESGLLTGVIDADEIEAFGALCEAIAGEGLRRLGVG